MSPIENGQSDLLKKKLTENIDSFKRKRVSNRKLAFRFKMIVVVLGSITTIILGLKPYIKVENGEALLSATALVLSAAVPIFSTWDAFFDYRWLWIRYTATLNNLYSIRDELDYASANGSPPSEKLNSLFGKLQNALSEVDLEWSNQRSKQANPSDRPD